MRILIVGAGALGGVIGAYLHRAGADVTLLDVNQARAALLARNGLLISRTGAEEICVPVAVTCSLEGLPPFDLVFVAVKTYQTTDAVGAVLSAVHPGTWFLSMQNGIGNAEAIADLTGSARVLCGITYHSMQHAGPGRLQFRPGIKPIQIAPLAGAVTTEIEAIGALFNGAGLDTNVVPDIEHVIWQKLLHNAVVNPVSALTGLTCREILRDADLLDFMRDLSAEIIAVMRARGIPIVDEEDPFRPIMGSLRALGKNRPSMWQDLARGRRTEVDAINGAVVEEAARLGLAAPHNRALVRFIHSRERQRFLNRREITRRLRLEAATTDSSPADRVAARTASRAAASGVRPTRMAPGGGMPASGPPLESTRRLRELMRTYYHDLTAAAADPHCLVGACSGLGPVEVLRALDISPYFPENHAALIGASRQGTRYLARATTEGFSQFASAAMRLDIGALLEGSSPLVTAHGIPGPPVPDVVVYSTNTGHELLRWFEFYGAHYDIPVVGLHPTPALHAIEQIDIDAAVHQWLRLIERLEATAGRTLETDRLGEVVGHSARACALWKEILGLARAVPAPLTFFDTLIHLAPVILLRGTPAATEYYHLLRDELQDRIAQGVAAVPGESFRLFWDGPPIWCALRPLAELFAERRMAIVGSSFAEVFALDGLDPIDPVESLARTYTGVFGNRSEEYKARWLAARFEEFGVDAAVYHDCRTTPEASHVRYGLAHRTEQRTGIPALIIEADSHDLRLFSAERLGRQLLDFVEHGMAGSAGPLQGAIS